MLFPFFADYHPLH